MFLVGFTGVIQVLMIVLEVAALVAASTFLAIRNKKQAGSEEKPQEPEEKKEEPQEEAPAEEEKAEEPQEEQPAEEEKAEEPEEEQPAEEEKAEEPEEEQPAEEEKAEEPEEEQPAEEEKTEEPEEETPAEEEKEEEPAEEEKTEEPEEEQPAEEEKKNNPEVVPVVAAGADETNDTDDVEKAKTMGKWVIKKKSEEDYIWNLIANNGEIILASESYSTAAGAKSGLPNIKESILQDRFQIHSDKNDHFFFKLKNGANKLQGMGQVYNTKQSAKNSIESVKRFCDAAEVVEDVVEELTYVKYEEKEPLDVSDVKDAYRGKWLIVKVDDDYQAKLQASNGEIILVTERYASTSSVNNAIDNLKKNAADANFIIDKDKNNRFFYRLRNDQNDTLAIGETYENKASCASSIESVRRFSATAEIVENY